MRYQDPMRDFFNNVDAIVAAGVSLPPEFVALRERLNKFSVIATPCRDRLRDALINPSSDDDLPMLRAAALIETEIEPHKLNGQARHWVFQKLKEINSAIAAGNYAKLAAEFDKIAKAFTAATKTVDVEADAATLISAPERERKTWVEAELLAQQLTEAVPGLQDAALLAGLADVRGDDVLALVADPGDELTGRQTWTAWFSKGRCGRWSALVAAGITLRAAKLDEFKPYTRTADDTGAKTEDPEPTPTGGGMVAV